MNLKERTVAALAKDCMTLEDYGPTVFVVMGGKILADSEDEESAKNIIDQARKLGEDDVFMFRWDPATP